VNALSCLECLRTQDEGVDPIQRKTITAAGDWARGVYANEDAIRHYERALHTLADCEGCDDLARAAGELVPTTQDWLRTARNLVKYAGGDDSYRDLERYLKANKLL
jgi:predicted component of type VI protein secretion system